MAMYSTVDWRGGYGAAKYNTVTGEGAMAWLSTIL